MKTWIDFDAAPVFAIPLSDPLDGTQHCEGMLIEGPQGWGEFSPPAGCDDRVAARWLTAAIEVGTVGWPDPLRGRVPIAVTVPAVETERARQLVVASGCAAASVRVATHPGCLPGDLARVAAVREVLGPTGAIRCDATGNWSLTEATAAIPELDRAGGGLEFVVQPCASLADLRSLRSRVDVPIAACQSINDAPDPSRVQVSGAADVAVLSVAALGGVRRALRVAEQCGLPCAVTSPVASSIGIAGGLALAGALPGTGFAAELGLAALLAGDVVSAGRTLRPVDGHLPVAPMPAAPEPEQIRRFTASAEATARWRARLDRARKAL